MYSINIYPNCPHTYISKESTNHSKSAHRIFEELFIRISTSPPEVEGGGAEAGEAGRGEAAASQEDGWRRGGGEEEEEAIQINSSSNILCADLL